MIFQLMNDSTGFEVIQDEQQVGYIKWTLDDDVMIMESTFVEESLRGQDVALDLLDLAAEYARQNDYKMKAVCSYVVKMFERSDRYDDVKM